MTNSAHPEIDFIQVLKEKRDLIWPTVENYLNKTVDVASLSSYKSDFSPIVDFYVETLTAYPKRKGKYVRATLLALTAEAMGIPLEKSVLTAAAWQVSEDWILSHDDWQDKSLERRGGPTLHLMYNPELAVNAGDALHIMQWKMISDNHLLLGPEVTFKLINEAERVLSRTTFGQSAEIKWTQDWKSLTDEEYFFIVDGKTSNYTIAGPMRLGAIIAGASNKQLELLLEFGQLLGRAFQIRDDYLDVTSDFAGLKKQQGNDIYESKRTIILGHLLRSANEEDKKQTEQILNKTRQEKTTEDVNLIIEKMKQYGSLAYAQNIANDLAQQAEKFFDEKLTFLTEEPARSNLKAGIKFMVNRDH